jgi:pimeloyl-ACP methyl ester carboxylesterase
MENSRLLVFPDCGHLPQEEFPLGFTKVVSDFCADQATAEQIQAVGCG